MTDALNLGAIAVRGIDDLVARTESLADTDWTLPTLPGWTVRELLDHCARALHQQSQAFENAAVASLQQPAFPHPQDWPATRVRTELGSGRDRMAAALNALDGAPAESLTPMPFGVVPTTVAFAIAVAEYEMHRWDLEVALDNTSHDLPPDAAAVSFGLMAGLLPMLAAGGTRPDHPITLSLASSDDASSLSLHYAGDEWRAGSGLSDEICMITGCLSDLVMFTVGRVAPAHRTVAASGPRSTSAADFKRWFPGP